MVKTGGPRPVKAKMNDVTATRAFGTDYTNNTGRPLLVIVAVSCIRISGAALYAYITGFVNGVNVAWGGLMSQTDNPDSGYDTIVLMVPPGIVYRVNEYEAAGCTVDLARWIEVEL